ncbi:hypothetical protein B0O80DRAFT_178310 [Mortierella sp. GBAus27b]|nr:hypothetical protein B0O80DRAFT_178310 [Mortierella sp. GBAus27b]
MNTGLDEHVTKLSAEANKHHDKITVALSRESLPKQLSSVLQQNTSVDISRWIVYFANERCLPFDHEDSNYLAKNELFNYVYIPEENIHPLVFPCLQKMQRITSRDWLRYSPLGIPCASPSLT